ncbi:MAG: hypothetical protein LBM95_08545 [Lactobacillales bacterium]|nr:hypothetical protein [Lactobacillales bacterium]
MNAVTYSNWRKKIPSHWNAANQINAYHSRIVLLIILSSLFYIAMIALIYFSNR